ncbi:MAG: feruloyl-CoA synthase [Bradyrhizobiaceae bacterium]|nr:feruloyl-CoA synthase [Bradyrhizobiaceae bacterium]
MSQAFKEQRFKPAAAPYRPVRLGPRDYVIDRRPDGTIYMRSPHPLGPYPVKMTERLHYWAEKAPDRTFMAQRDERGEWRRLTYGEALTAARSIGEYLLRHELSPEHPVAILSGNDIEHALLALGAMYVGVPFVPISPAYSLISGDFGKLKHIFNLLTPGLVFAADGRLFHRAIETAVPAGLEVIVARNPLAQPATKLFSELTATKPTAAVDAAQDKVGPDTVVKFLFTSGSTGMPKGVINTQRMWCSNQKMILSQLAYFEDEPPVILDWSPWHHTASGNHNFGFILYNGGTCYIDEGKPLPGAIETTVRNLREIACTWYFTVPKGYEALLPFFRSDAELRKTFFSKLKVLWFAGAALAQSIFDEMQDLAEQTIGERVMFLTGLGATETSPMAIARMWMSKDSTNMGLPVPGVELKLVPNEGKLEARVKGPNITPGYWRQPELTAKAFDEEGFYKLGDALKFEDPNDPGLGLLFDGRVAEDFKLSTGTWVSVGPLRAGFLAHFEPYVRDVVIAGGDREEIAVLVFPAIDACRRLAPDLAADAPPETLLADPRVIAEFRSRLNSFAKKSTGSSNRVCRAILLAELPSLDAGEMTDKGSINQRAVLSRRAALVEELYAKEPSARVIRIDGKS